MTIITELPRWRSWAARRAAWRLVDLAVLSVAVPTALHYLGALFAALPPIA